MPSVPRPSPKSPGVAPHSRSPRMEAVLPSSPQTPHGGRCHKQTWHHHSRHHCAFFTSLDLFHDRKREGGKKYPISISFFCSAGVISTKGGKRRRRLRLPWPALPGTGDGADDSREGRGEATCARGRNVCKPKKSHVQAGSMLRPGAPAASGSERLRPPARSPGTAGTGSSCLCTSIAREGSTPFLCYNTFKWDGSKRHGFKCRGFKCTCFKCDGSNCNSSDCNAKPGLPGVIKAPRSRVSQPSAATDCLLAWHSHRPTAHCALIHMGSKELLRAARWPCHQQPALQPESWSRALQTLHSIPRPPR